MYDVQQTATFIKCDAFCDISGAALWPVKCQVEVPPSQACNAEGGPGYRIHLTGGQSCRYPTPFKQTQWLLYTPPADILKLRILPTDYICVLLAINSVCLPKTVLIGWSVLAETQRLFCEVRPIFIYSFQEIPSIAQSAREFDICTTGLQTFTAMLSLHDPTVKASPSATKRQAHRPIFMPYVLTPLVRGSSVPRQAYRLQHCKK
jgi:hypothetical protein